MSFLLLTNNELGNAPTFPLNNFNTCIYKHFRHHLTPPCYAQWIVYNDTCIYVQIDFMHLSKLNYNGVGRSPIFFSEERGGDVINGSESQDFFYEAPPPPKILINMIRARLVYVYMYIIVRIYFFFYIFVHASSCCPLRVPNCSIIELNWIVLHFYDKTLEGQFNKTAGRIIVGDQV